MRIVVRIYRIFSSTSPAESPKDWDFSPALCRQLTHESIIIDEVVGELPVAVAQLHRDVGAVLWGQDSVLRTLNKNFTQLFFGVFDNLCVTWLSKLGCKPAHVKIR